MWFVFTILIIRSAAARLDSHERYRLQSGDGRLYDVDELLGNLTRGHPPPIGEASRQLAAFGVTGINDMTPSNNLQTRDWFAELISTGEILQKARLSGRPGLTAAQFPHPNRLTPGETKFHLHDSSLHDFPELVEGITRSHRDNRNVAIHCVTELELVFSLSALRAAGTQKGDRIEHASVVPPVLVEQLLELELGVVTQPNFIYERGDAYLEDIPGGEHPFLYRVNSLVNAGVPVAFGTDGPFGHPDPWMAMNAAVNRQTSSGKLLGEQECISPENALMGFLGFFRRTRRPIYAANNLARRTGRYVPVISSVESNAQGSLEHPCAYDHSGW